MQIVAGLLTEDDVKSVAAYLSSRPAPDGSGPGRQARQSAMPLRLRQPAATEGDGS